jgi:hypothetical protein
LEEKTGNELKIWFNLNRRTTMKTIIHVNQFMIRRNKKTGEKNPVITVKNYKENKYAHEVVIKGDCKLIYKPESPLSCGAHVWIETDGEVEIIGEAINSKEIFCKRNNSECKIKRKTN